MYYALRNDGYKFQELHLEIEDFIDSFPEEIGFLEAYNFSINNLAMENWWPKIKASFLPIENDYSAPIPDVSKWINATLVLSPKAYNVIGNDLIKYGELLPIKVLNQTFYIFNCLNSIPIDESKSKKAYYDDQVIGWKSLVFPDSNTEKNVIFKSKDQGCIDLFCDDQLKALVEKYQLSGIIFDSNLVRDFNE